MGSRVSKSYCGGAGASSSSSPPPRPSSGGGGGGGGGRKGKSRGSRVFRSSCLGAPSGSRHSNDVTVCDNGNKENGGSASSANHNEMELHQVKTDCYRKLKLEHSDEMCCISSNPELDEWSQVNIANIASRTGSTSARAASTHSLIPPSRFFSRHCFIPGNVSFRLSRATSLGSSSTYHIPSTSVRMLNDDDDEESCIRPRSANGSEAHQGSDFLPTSLINRTPAHRPDAASATLQINGQASEFLDNMTDNQTISSMHDISRDWGSTRMDIDRNLHSPRLFSELECVETRVSDRWPGAQEPVDRNARFSRTLSVGRLRGRVLQQSSQSDLTFCPSQQEREVADSSLGSSETRESEGNALTPPTITGYPPSSMSRSLFSAQDHEVETSRTREARYHDLLEHRSNFLERRRRIRSQVRALQRLGSRFDNLSGHERSCILSDQHRTGCCTCHVNNRDGNSSDGTSARASISRIVMLAEALFEVLDEIHQQSVVLSSRPSVSSLGSVPAPNEVVESLPIKLYSKSQKHQNEEGAQCYICLVEYDEGDSMRVLPCHHEFHQTCIDKWLKEIHRVCPVCRGDICRSDSFSVENQG